MQQCEQLRKYNRWRRGDKRLKMPDPKELGELIDGVADRLEVLEREHAEFFDRWHEHRRAIEAIVRVLGPSAPTCDGCAVEIAEALKIARKLGYGDTAPEGHNFVFWRQLCRVTSECLITCSASHGLEAKITRNTA